TTTPCRRTGSPSPGGSILITSAPMSASSMLQKGPARIRVRSTTLTPERGTGVPPLPASYQSFRRRRIRWPCLPSISGVWSGDITHRAGEDRMKAIVFSELRGPEVLSLADVPKPEVRPDMVLLKIGRLRIYIGKTFPLAQAADAHRYMES